MQADGRAASAPKSTRRAEQADRERAVPPMSALLAAGAAAEAVCTPPPAPEAGAQRGAGPEQEPREAKRGRSAARRKAA